MRTVEQPHQRRPAAGGLPRSSGSGRDRRGLLLAVLVVSVSVVVLDNTVLTVALPRIQQEVGASQSQQEWMVAAYTLVFAALLFPFGVLADRSGRRRVLAGGLALFGLGSLASAYAGSAGVLIGWRAVMGVGAAAVLPATLSILTNVYDGLERGRAIAVWAGASGVALAIGPLVGGGLLEAGLWWGSVFMINLPVVAVGLAGIGLLVPESHDPARPRLDPVGVLLSVVGLFLLVYGIIEAGQQSRWTSPATGGFILAGLAVLAAFIWIESRTRHAALDLSWFRRPTFATASLAIALATFALSGMMLYGTYYLQFDRGYSPLRAGLLMLGMATAMGLSAPLSARLVSRYGVRLVCATGLAALAATYALLTLVEHATPIAVPAALLVLLGAGMAGVFAPATEAIMAALPRERAGAGAAVNSTVRQLAAALGIAALGSLLSTTYRSAISEALARFPAPVRQAAGESIGATQALAHRLPDHGGGLLESASDAFIQAMQLTAAASAAVMLLAVVIVLIWTPRHPAPPQGHPSSAPSGTAGPPGRGLPGRAT